MSSSAATLAAAAGAGLVAAATVAVFHPWAMWFGPGVWRGPKDSQSVALTFDDGPHPIYTPAIAHTLERYGAHATFFCVGERLKKWPEVGQALLQAGHELANHSHRHGIGGDLFSASRLSEDLGQCQSVLQDLTGSRCRYYRPAVGVRNPAVHAAARRWGLTVTTWTWAARDGGIAFSPRRARALAQRARPGHILALHDGTSASRSRLREHSLASLPVLLEGLKAKGLHCVTLTQLLHP